MSASPTPNIGLNMKLYRNTGTYGAPTWSLIPNVVDLKMDPGTADEVDVATRGSGGGQRQFEPGMKAAAYEWDMLWKQSDADLAALITAWQNGSLVEFAFADGPIASSGTNYFRHECKIFSIARDEPLSDKVPAHIVAKPCFSANSPTYTSVP